jgi:hypothetical protein
MKPGPGEEPVNSFKRTRREGPVVGIIAHVAVAVFYGAFALPEMTADR